VPTNNTLHANSLNVSSTDVVSFEIARLNHDVSNVIILIPNSRPKVTSQITLIFFGESYVRELLRLSGRPSLLVSAHDRTWQSRLGSSPTVPPSRLSLVFASSCPPGSSKWHLQLAQCNTTCTKLHSLHLLQPKRRHSDLRADHPHSYPAQYTPTPEHRTRPHTSTTDRYPYSLVAARAHVEMQGKATDAEDGKP
jgi:hypothetical protein